MSPTTAEQSMPTEPSAVSVPSLRHKASLQGLKEACIRWLLFGCASVSVLTTVSIIFVLLYESVLPFPGHRPFFAEVSLKEFLTDTRWTPQFSTKHFGILPLLCDTLLVTAISGLVGLPMGLLSAVYLSEYAGPRRRNFLKPVLELLAGIPTVVYGYFGLNVVTPYVLRPILQSGLGLQVEIFNALSGGIVVGLMTLPLVTSLSEDVLRAVPKSLREAGYALGATKFDVSVKIVVPSALSGILASFLLALSRAIGETMAVTIACGQRPVLTINPLVQIQTMTSYVVNVMKGDTPAGTIEYNSLYAVALVLFLITLSMNIVSQFILSRYREVYN